MVLYIIKSITFITVLETFILGHEGIFFWRKGKHDVAEGPGVSSKNILKN
jgi:hypothetical protein